MRRAPVSSTTAHAASLVYSGYDHFDSDEWHFGINERGAPKTLAHGAARRSLAQAADEERARTETFAYGATGGDLPPHQPHFGITIVTCAGGDMRASADGVTVYGRDGIREIPLSRGAGMPGRREVLDDMRIAIRSGRPPIQGGRWGKATVEVALAILQSARTGQDVALEHQVGVLGRVVRVPTRRCGTASSRQGSRPASIPAPRPRRNSAASRC